MLKVVCAQENVLGIAVAASEEVVIGTIDVL